MVLEDFGMLLRKIERPRQTEGPMALASCDAHGSIPIRSQVFEGEEEELDGEEWKPFEVHYGQGVWDPV